MSADSLPSRWLYGPLPDLVLGCGLGYVAIFAVLGVVGPGYSLPAVAVPLLVLAFSAPHYGATLLRVYEHRADRRGYALFSVWTTLAIAVAVVVGVYDRGVAIALYTLYLTWSPWHYSGQNYGIAVMFLRRGGVDLDPVTKRLLYGFFVSTFTVTLLTLHDASATLNYNPNAVPYGEDLVMVYPLGIPSGINRVLLLGTLVVSFACAVGALVRLRQRASWSGLAPAGILMTVQALWFAVPFSIVYFGARTGFAPLDDVASFVLWAALAHALQYLWITSYYARRSASSDSQALYLFKALSVGTAIWTLPVILFAPDWSGGPEYEAGLALLVAAGVNIHHFVLDGAIWKLRNLRIASVLLRPRAEDPHAPISPEGGSAWFARGVWALCGAALAVALAVVWEGHAFGLRVGAGDLAAAEATLDRLALVGQDSSALRARVGQGWASAGETARAREQLERSLALRPNAAAWTGLAQLAAGRGDWAGVLEVFDRAGEVDSFAFERLAVAAWYQLGEPARGRERMAQLAERQPESAHRHLQLAGLARTVGDTQLAVGYYRESLRLEPDQRNAANDLAWILATADDPAVRDPEAAVRWSLLAVGSLESPDANLLDTLAVAYEAAGRRVEARSTGLRAAELARAQGQTTLAEGIEARMRETGVDGH